MQSIILVTAAAILLFSLLYWAYTFTVLYHLVRFGVGAGIKRLAAVYVVGSAFLFVSAVLLLALSPAFIAPLVDAISAPVSNPHSP